MRVPKSYKLPQENGTCHYCPFVSLRTLSWEEGLSQSWGPIALWLQGQEKREHGKRQESHRGQEVHVLPASVREKIRAHVLNNRTIWDSYNFPRLTILVALFPQRD